MTYESQANLSQDQALKERVAACCMEQALVFKDDGRREFYLLARQFVQVPATTEGYYTVLCGTPNFADVTDGSTVTDGAILAAVQAYWGGYGEILYPEVPA